MKTIFVLFLLFANIGIFAQSKTISQVDLLRAAEEESNEATIDFLASPQLAMSNADYMVTPGDVYSLTFAVGTNAVSYTIPVDTTYKIRVANLAVLDATGRSFLWLKSEVEKIVTKNFPMSGVQFVHISPATFKVTLLGEVTETTERNAWALSRLSSVIGNSLTRYASVRDVVVISASGREKTYDLFKASRLGDMSQDPYLRPGDVIVFKRFERRVTVYGAVERPGSYDLLPGENLRSLIDFYGDGLTETADVTRMEIVRTLFENAGVAKSLYLGEKEYNSDYELKCYDTLKIASYSDLRPVMFIEGAVFSASFLDSTSMDSPTDASGIVDSTSSDLISLDLSSLDSNSLDSSNRLTVAFNEGENYAYLARRVKKIFSEISDLSAAYIVRGNERFPVDLNSFLYDANFYSDYFVEKNDVLVVPFRQLFVSVAGSVVAPGRYPYIPDRNWEYYIGLAGGFIPAQNSRKSITIVDVAGNELSKSDVVTPEATITAKANSFTYYFNQYAPVVTTILSLVTSVFSIIAATAN